MMKFDLKSLVSTGFVAGIAILASPAIAQSKPAAVEMPYKAEVVRCVDNADNNAAFSICYGKAAEAALVELEKRNKAMLERFKDDPGTTESFKKEVVVWQAYKEEVCSYYYQQPFFGSVHRAIVGPRCTLKVIEDRIELLDNQIANWDYE